MVKNPPANTGDQRDVGLISGLGRFPWWEEMATHSSIFAWEIPRTVEPGGLQSIESQRVRHNRATEHTHTRIVPLQYRVNFRCYIHIYIYISALFSRFFYYSLLQDIEHIA